MFTYLQIQTVACTSFILFQLFLAMGAPLEPTISVIYNSLRYDDNTHIVTFHLREKDWDELKSTSRMWISSADADLLNIFQVQVINREPVPLGDEIVKSVQVVDPLKTFGLFSVQAFTVSESSENCHVLKVSHLVIIRGAVAPLLVRSSPDRAVRDTHIRCALGQENLLSKYLSSPRCINWYQRS